MCMLITIIDDDVIENDEQISIGLNANEISNNQPLQVTIMDNDGKGHRLKPHVHLHRHN